MNIHIARNVAVCLAVAGWFIAADIASAQLFRPRPRNYGQPAQPVTPDPTTQAAQAPIPNQSTAQPIQAMQSAHPNQVGQIVRGSQLIGLTIMDSRSQKLGTIKDILIDQQTMRVAYLLMAAEGTEVNTDWIVIPFDAVQLSASAADRQPTIILNFEPDQLTRAPHMRRDAWGTIRDPQFLGQVQQFYHRTEWTAGRANGQMNGTMPAVPKSNQVQQNGQGQTFGAPGQGQENRGNQTPGATPSGKTTRHGNAPAQPEEPKPSLENEKRDSDKIKAENDSTSGASKAQSTSGNQVNDKEKKDKERSPNAGSIR